MPKLPYYFVDNQKVVKVTDLIIFFDDLEEGNMLPDNKKRYRIMKEFFKKMEKQ